MGGRRRSATYAARIKGKKGKWLARKGAELVTGIYERIEARGPEIVRARLTPDAYAHGLALALPERGRYELAGAEGFEPSIP